MNFAVNQQLQEAAQFFQVQKFEAADRVITKLLYDYPQLTEALLLKAQIEQSTAQFDIARAILLSCVHLPNLTSQQWLELAKVCNQFELYFLLKIPLQNLVKAHPENLNYLFNLSLCLAKIGQIPQSVKLALECEKQHFQHPMLWINLGHGYKALGDSGLASEYYQRFIREQPQFIGTGFWSLADLKDYQFDDNDHRVMLEALPKQHAAEQRALLSFAIGKSFENKKSAEQAFEHYRSANKVMAKIRPFNGAGFSKWCGSLIESKTFAESGSANSNIPIFIVGLPRSGTTLTEQILASHSDVECTDELPYIERIAMQLCTGQSYGEAIRNMSPELRLRMREYYLQQCQDYLGGHDGYFIDKNPTNFAHIGLIHTLFPEAKIIALFRDPVDNCMSVFKQHFSRGNDFSYSIESIIEYTEAYYQMINYWQPKLSNNLYVLPYERLVNEHELEIKRLLAFCELPFEAQCLTFHTSKRAVLTPSVSQVRQPINNGSLKSGYQYEIQLRPYWKQLLNLKNAMPE